VRKDRLPYVTGVEKTQLYPTSKLLSHITGVKVQPNKAIVGDNAFAHEAGIHQDGVLKHALTYEIMTPESVGISQNAIVLGKHSGRHAFKNRLEELGFHFTGPALDRVFEAFKALADRKKCIYDEDLIVLAEGRNEEVKETYRLESIVVASGSGTTPRATVVLVIDGVRKEGAADGVGAIDATFKAIVAISQFKGTLTQFKINAVTGGTDAQGEVVVGISDNGRSARGIASDTDIIVAAARAFIQALNRLALWHSHEAGI
jgi:2-isopropylmalate synthase